MVRSETPAALPPRAYRSTRRAQQAAQTRADVIAAAQRVFGETGWKGATVATIAKEGGVAVETIYATFGSKSGLLRAAFDAAVVGDAEPIPLVERPEFESFGIGTLEQRVQAGLDFLADSFERSARIWRAVLDAAASDPALEDWRRESEGRRRIDSRRSLEAIFEQPVEPLIFEAVVVLIGPNAYLDLVVDAGLSRRDYQRCIREALIRLMTVPND